MFQGSLPARFPQVRIDSQSTGMGHGLRTCQAMHRGDLIVEFLGERISNRRRMGRPPSPYTLMLGNGSCIDASSHGSLARFVNHQCKFTNT